MEIIEQKGFCASCQAERPFEGGQTVEIPDGQNGAAHGLRGVCPICGSTMLAVEDKL